MADVLFCRKCGHNATWHRLTCVHSIKASRCRCVEFSAGSHETSDSRTRDTALNRRHGARIKQALEREPLPAVHSAWEGDERTEDAYLDGWRSAREWYGLLIAKGWPDSDGCLTKGCVFQRGHVGRHAIGNDIEIPATESDS